MQENSNRKSEEELIRQTLFGDKRSFAVLYELHFDALYRFVYSRTGNTVVTEDIVSETWALIIENLERFNYQSKFRTFLFGFALNLVRRIYAQEKTVEFDNELIEEEIEEVELSDESVKVDRYITQIKSVMPALKQNYKEVIQKRFFEEMNLKETADSMQITVQNVKVLQHRAIIKIKQLLENED